MGKKPGMGSKISGAFHDIKTALIGDKKATNLRQEEIDSTIIPTNQTILPGGQQSNLMQ